MTFLREWLLGVVGAALAVALAQSLTPEGTIKKVGTLLGGLVLLLAAIRPVAALDPQDLAALVPDQGTWEESASDVGEEMIKALIAEKTSAYIVDKGRELGVSCTVRVVVGEDPSGWAVPRSVEIVGVWSKQEREALSQAIARELDIPPQRQIFREEEP